MLKILLIDDDKMEPVFWRRLASTHLADKITFFWAASVEQGIAQALEIEPDVTLIDNRIPPHSSAVFALRELARIEYGGRIFVWSNGQLEDLHAQLADFPAVEALSKQDYVGMKIQSLVETRFLDSDLC